MKKYVSPEIEIKEFKDKAVLVGSGTFQLNKQDNEAPVVFYSIGKIF